MEKSGIIRASSNRNIPMNVFNNLDTLDFSYHNKKLIGRLPDVKFEKIGLYQDQYRKTVPDKNVYRKAIKEKFNSRKSFDPDAKYNAKTINDSLYFNTGVLIMGMCK